MSSAQGGEWTPERRAEHAEKMRKAWTPERRKRHGDLTRERHRRERERARHIAAAPEVTIGGETYVRGDIVDALVEALAHRDPEGAVYDAQAALAAFDASLTPSTETQEDT